MRVWDETSDGLGTPPWDAALNRHVAQRNIHVVAGTGGPRARGAGAPRVLPSPVPPLTLKVGPLYGDSAQVTVAPSCSARHVVAAAAHRHQGPFPGPGSSHRGRLALRADVHRRRSVAGGALAPTHDVTGDDQQVQLTTSDAPPAPGQAHVYRVTASQDGQVFGGYTVVILG